MHAKTLKKLLPSAAISNPHVNMTTTGQLIVFMVQLVQIPTHLTHFYPKLFLLVSH